MIYFKFKREKCIIKSNGLQKKLISMIDIKQLLKVS